uniref:Uncharacterized protein n=1 Tax=Pseudomonas phage HRDY3 TaxID=3236930 RepID=A0AB39CDT8_9VIRU
MKFVVVNIDGTEVPMMFGNEVDLDKIQIPYPIVSAGVAVVQEMFLTCQLTQTIGGVEYQSRGPKDEMLLRMNDHIGQGNPELSVTAETVASFSENWDQLRGQPAVVEAAEQESKKEE